MTPQEQKIAIDEAEKRHPLYDSEGRLVLNRHTIRENWAFKQGCEFMCQIKQKEIDELQSKIKELEEKEKQRIRDFKEM